jgi:hypothetical protein
MEDGPKGLGYVSSVSMWRWGPRRSERTDMQRSAAKPHGSSVRLGFRVVSSPLRAALLALPLIGAALLIAAEFSTLYDVRVVTAVPDGGSFSAGGHHGYALGVIGVGIGVMTLGAVLGGSRPAAVAALVLAAAALAIALAIDLPDVHETGLIGRTYDAAQAEPRAGLYLELAGGCAALLGAALILVLRPTAPRRSRGRRTAAVR